jgi:glycosyltransferase involved in cell wall biosynthesis
MHDSRLLVKMNSPKRKQENGILVSAYNIHVGGGATLLKQILKNLNNKKNLCFLDKRFEIECFNMNPVQVPKSILGRLQAEREIQRQAKNYELILTLGNLPPLFKNKSFNILFIQNKYLVSNFSIKGFSLGTRIRITIERLWLKKFIKNIDLAVVQTEHMKSAFQGYISKNVNVMVLPFCDNIKPNIEFERRLNPARKFLYVAGPEPHKNHNRLTSAWKRFHSLFPDTELTLTVDGGKNSHGIRYLGSIDRAEVMKLYHSHDALLYPSLLESLGLPLLEARLSGMPLIVSDLEYAYEVSNPDLVFNPYDENDIFNTLKKAYRGEWSKPGDSVRQRPLEVIGAREFLEKVTEVYDKNF